MGAVATEFSSSLVQGRWICPLGLSDSDLWKNSVGETS